MSSRSSQTGATLVEVLIALALVGILVLALASGMLTLIKTSAETTKQQQIELALGSFTESLKSGPYTECAVPLESDGQYPNAAWIPPPSMTASVVKIEYWDPMIEDFADPMIGDFDEDCSDGDQGTQRLTVQVKFQGHFSCAQVVKADGTPTTPITTTTITATTTTTTPVCT
jgi:prepilin-type N-terminal cleavage/methylation domain-containing protein